MKNEALANANMKHLLRKYEEKRTYRLKMCRRHASFRPIRSQLAFANANLLITYFLYSQCIITPTFKQKSNNTFVNEK